MNSFDYLIAGTGAAGLSLAMHICSDPRLRQKKILMIDRQEKNSNDRTWCFWEDGDGFFQPVVSHQWAKAWFHGQNSSRLLDLAPYRYKLIHAADFYQYCRNYLQKLENVSWLGGEITDLSGQGEKASCRVNGEIHEAGYIFSSIFEKPELRKGDHYLLQHFTGWKIKTGAAAFDPAQPVLMDFRVGQERGATFVYVLPFSEREALVEYTLFSGSLLQPREYESGLREYLARFYPSVEYTVTGTETGIIPMTDHRFPTHDGRVVFIGTAGGWTKPSTGYTFSFIQKHCRRIVEQLARDGNPVPALKKLPRRFHFYDSTLLEILEKGSVPGHIVFERLFMKNDPGKILKFLDNETRLSEEIGLLLTLPVLPFTKAALKVAR